ncbi:hypothetical protein [Enterococcus sp. AZ058]|uniref:hypothetical protein n=1 Tax=Enterococcus sp. AZ058 TaxID=2774838 RepID=UPI003D2D1185
MIFYHSTYQKKKILKDDKIKEQQFNYIKYIEYILDVLTKQDVEDMKIPYSYPGAKIQAPFMGIGIYCFDNLVSAASYKSQAKIVNILYHNDFTLFDLDDPIVKAHIYIILEDEAERVINEMSDVNSKEVWLLILDVIRKAFYEDFVNCQPVVGIFLHFWYLILKKQSHDIIKKGFYDMIDVERKRNQEYYFLIKNKQKIISLS